jgi:membrane protein DedA with SNARE-associated domain
VGALEAAIVSNGGRLILLNVFLQQIGVPIPAEPTLLVAGSLVARGRLSLAAIVTAILLATFIADLSWFLVGRRFGTRALSFVFRGASQPEKRRVQVEQLFTQWGSAAFALAKFIPGIPMASPALAGALGIRVRVFLLYDLLAMSLWGGAFLGLGVLFHRDIAGIMRGLDRLGIWALAAGAVVVVAVVANSLRRRREPKA